MKYEKALTYLAGLATGIGIGVLATKTYFDKKYQERFNRDADEMRSSYNRRLSELSARNLNKPDVSELIHEVTKPKDSNTPVTANPFYNYAKLSEQEATPEEIANAVMSPPGPVLEKIDQDDYDTPNGYEKIHAIVYSDGITATEQEDDILNVDETVGVDAVMQVMRGHEDAVYVRNRTRMTEYELVGSQYTYTEVTGIQVRG